ncbi:TPA: hypothetical protein KDY05_001999 [Vibrio parahaemolyticus]|nr:hypothetical protein [Vibrio parahaemolyticus]
MKNATMALALLLTSTAYADELKLSGAQNFAINDEVVKFQVADIDNDGQLDIAFVDANGQLKFAPKESPSDVTELLVGEDVKEFQFVDLNENGHLDLVFTNANGEIKYSRQGSVDKSSLTILKSHKWLVDGANLKLYFKSGAIYYAVNPSNPDIIKTSYFLEDGAYVGGTATSGEYIKVDYVTETEISGTIRSRWTDGTVQFTAKPL